MTLSAARLAWMGRVFFAGLFMLSCSSGGAQKVITELPRVQLSSHFNLLFPRPPVSTFLDDLDSGYDIDLMYRLQHNKPVLAGVYWAESWLSKQTSEYADTVGGQIIDYRERANTRRFELGLVMGYYPEFNWMFQPFVQGRIGLGLFQSSSIIIDEEEDETVDRISEQRSSVLAYGLEVGLHIIPNAWYVRGSIRFGIRANPSTTFMAYDPERENTTPYPINSFSTYTSSARWLFGSIGVTFLLGGEAINAMTE